MIDVKATHVAPPKRGNEGSPMPKLPPIARGRREDVLAIDPGYSEKGEGCACALVLGGLLTEVWFERSGERPQHDQLSVDVVLWEKPQMDSRTWGVPPKVMIELTAAGATLAGLYAGDSLTCARLVAVTPSNSKGSVPKPVAHSALWERLTPRERRLLGGEATHRQIEAACERGALERWRRPGADYYPTNWLDHNKLDAVDLGISYIGR